MQYTFHADRGHVSLIDHMLVSECLIHVRNSVIIHMDDSNVSDLRCNIFCLSGGTLV